jgi:hypothetical protein
MKFSKKLYLVAGLAVSLAFTACSDQGDKKAPSTEAKKPAAPQEQKAASQQAPVAPQSVAATLSGTVTETFDGGGYTYMKLDTETGEQWAAIGQAPVKVGDTVNLKPGPVMKDFYSRTFDRTFPSIVFSSGMAGGNGGAPSDFGSALQGEAAGMMPATMGMAQESGGSMQAVSPLQEIKIDKVEGENGFTIEEVFAQAADLDGKKVKIRGKAVKVSPNIMGKNWIHIQDGTGNPMSNSHDLVVTTSDMPEKDSIIVVEGFVAKDKDFGAGYKYNVIVEEAVVTQ